MKKLIMGAAVVVFAALAGILAFGPPVLADSDGTEALNQLFADDWEFYLEQAPVFASGFGDLRFNAKLSDPSEKAARSRRDTNKEFLERLSEIDRSALSADDQVNYDIFKRLKEDRLREFEFKLYLTPITNRWGFHVAFAQLPDDVPLQTEENYEDYVQRLELFKEYCEAHIEVMRKGIAEGYVLPKIVMEGVEGTIDPHVVDDATESLLYAPFEDYPENIGEAERKKLTEKGRKAIDESVIPGYQMFFDFMVDEYIPSSRENIAASALPNGQAYYEYRVRRFTTLDVTPQEVHDRGLAEVARIRTEMQEIIDSVEFEGSFDDFVSFLRTDEQFYAKTPDELMQYVALALKKMDGQLPTLFGTLPRMPYGIKPVPDYIAPKTTTAYYNAPSGDGTKAGFYFVNTYDLKSRPLYEVEALSLHEAVPGHHLQIALQQELEDMPEFRRFTGFTAFSEGWALYSERLGLEAGFYADPYSDFGRLTYEMWRATRLVVDTGIHYFGWTRQRAINFMASNSALTVHNITTEVDRYISWPGQALAYKTGELKIRELRSMAEDELGSEFDVRSFHDVVLGSGAVPLDILEANVKAWVQSQKAKS